MSGGREHRRLVTLIASAHAPLEGHPEPSHGSFSGASSASSRWGWGWGEEFDGINPESHTEPFEGPDRKIYLPDLDALERPEVDFAGIRCGFLRQMPFLSDPPDVMRDASTNIGAGGSCPGHARGSERAVSGQKNGVVRRNLWYWTPAEETIPR